MIKQKAVEGSRMENNQNNMQTILAQLEKSSRARTRYARLQFLFTVATAVFCLILLILVSGALPKVAELIDEVNTLAAQAETVLTNLDAVTGALASADLAGMVANVDSLAVSSQNGMKQALDKISAIDIEALNEAIQDLSSVVGPLADLMNRWN